MAFFGLGGLGRLGLSNPFPAIARPVSVLVLVVALLASACSSPPTTLALAAEDDFGREVVEVEQVDLRADVEDIDLASNAPEVTDLPVTTTTAPATIAADAAPSTTTASATDATPVRAVTTWVATATDAVTHLIAYDAPDGTVIPFEFLVPNPHQFGGPQVLMVTSGSPEDEWVQVQLPIRPNGQTGWIRSSLYEFSQTQIRAEVNLTDRSIVVYDGTEILAETQAVIGSSNTPTPVGTFFITAKRQNPPEESYIGPWALALSAYSEVYETFGGGLPVIAIHGTTSPHQVGEARSNGCLRIPNDVVTFLAENVPLGAPVTISA